MIAITKACDSSDIQIRISTKMIKKQSSPRTDLSDLSQVFEADDILGVQQAIKGFDKSDFCEVYPNYPKRYLT